MDGRELLRRLALRWPLVLLALVLALAIGAITFAATPATYTVQAGVLVLPASTDPGGSAPINPLSALDSGAVQVASTLVYAAGSPGTVQAVADASNGGAATAVNTTDDPSNHTPFIQITATGPTPNDATVAARAEILSLNSELSALQTNAKVPKPLLMRLAVVVTPVPATASATGRLKAAGLAAAIVFVLALLVIAVLDRFLPSTFGGDLRHRIAEAARRVRPNEPDAEAEPTVPTGTPVSSAAGRD